MSVCTEKIELSEETAKMLHQLAEWKNTSVSGLLDNLAAYLPLLCELNEIGAREYREFSNEYKNLIGAEDCFLSTMAYHDFTNEEAAAPLPQCSDILRTILGIAYGKSAPRGQAEDDTGCIVAAVSAKL